MRGRRGRLVPSAPQKACYEERRRNTVHPKIPLPNKSAASGKKTREGPPVVGIEGWAVAAPPAVTVTVPTIP